jgi:hypothetical protein
MKLVMMTAVYQTIEVCTGPVLALGSWPDPARRPGPGQIEQIMLGSGPGSNDNNLNIPGFLGPLFFSKEN